MKRKTLLRHCAVGVAGLLVTAWGLSTQAATIADSRTEFSGNQGQNGWYNGYRNVTIDGKGIDYDPAADFIPFAGGEGQGAWDGVNQIWTGTAWDLNTAGAAPWTWIAQEQLHPNGINNGEEHWAIRRWTGAELTAATPLGITWHVRKGAAAGAGVTGALHLNGLRVQASALNTTAGVTNVYYLMGNPADWIDLILSPVGPTGDTGDGSDGSWNWMTVETVPDSDSDNLPDPWEFIYFPGDLTKLSANGDFDVDGLKDGVEMGKGTNPALADTDADGLKDGVETNTGTYVSVTDTGTNPLKADTDGDGRKDGDEINGPPKTDVFDPDSDDDTYLDGDEVATGHDPNDANDNPETTAIANSMTQFSGEQGLNDWFWGYRNYTKDGGGEGYNPATGFIAFDPATQWNGAMWDLDPTARNPWTELGTENTHPNSSTAANPDGFDTGIHWTIRRWVAASLTKVTPLAIRWHVRKTNTGGGNGVTGALYLNGQRKDAVVIAGNNGTGVTHTYFINVAPNDILDLILSPRGLDGADADGSDGSATRMLVDPTIPASPIQPDGSVFIPVGAGDTDADGLPDVWEKIYFPTDLTKLTANGDYDTDGLKDPGEYGRGTDPTKPDTDGDGLGDNPETGTGTYVSATDTGSDATKPDTDGDGLGDGAEVNGTPASDPNKADTDADGFSDPEELAAGTDPRNPADNPLTGVIANSEKQFSGTQGKDGWYNGYREFDPTSDPVDYNPTTDFIPFPGGTDQGPWDGATQTWDGGGAWDLNTAAAGPWTYQSALSVHPNGTNSPAMIGGDPGKEHWIMRRWVASGLTKTTPLALIWLMKKENPNPDGVTGLLFINGKLVDSKSITGTDTTGVNRRFFANVKNGDVIDLALTPEGPTGDRFDYSDGSITRLWVDTKIPPNPTQPDGTPFVPAGALNVGIAVNAAQTQITLTWAAEAGSTYTVWGSSDFKAWVKVQEGITGGSHVIAIGTGPGHQFYRVSQP